jgi:hypothetical protein
VTTRRELDELYARDIRPLPLDDRLELLELLVRDLALDYESTKRRERSLLELEGLGAEMWQGIDAQAYVRALRAEWDQRP